MIVTHNVIIDLSDRGSFPQIDAMQDDQYTRDLAITLMSGEAEWPVPEDASVVIRYCKSDGVGGEYDTLPDGTKAWSVSGNVLTLALAPQVLTVPGTVMLSATLIREEQILSIFSVHIHVRHRVRGIFAESQGYYNVMGFLPGPVNAEAGQYLRVAKVDDTGRVVAVEAVDSVPGNSSASSATVLTSLKTWYGISQSSVVPPREWSDVFPEMSAEYPYLWIKVDKNYSDGTAVADIGVIGYYAADGSGEGTVTSGAEPGADDIPKVYFTGTLPTSKEEGDVQVQIHYISKTMEFTYPATLKVQGSSSANYPKKNFTLKLYEDETYESKMKMAFKDWGNLNKFVLKAHWIDHSHIRNVGSAKIWGKIMAARSDYDSLPEELRSAPNNGATDGFTCKVFSNGVYQGLYEWIVPKDKLFGQDSDNANHSILNSEWNNQPTCAFATTSPTISGNWSEELLDDMTEETKASMENWIAFVAGSSDDAFVAEAEKYFDVQSVIDADIFDRVFCTVDNLCRNQIVFKYADKWFVGKWDLDAVLGLPPLPGQSFFPYNTEYQTGYVAYKDYKITNMLYQRVENLFLDRFKARYAQLRAGVLSIENILDVYERLTDVITSYDGLLEEDYASTTGGGKFTGIPYPGQNNIQQIRNFVAQRIPYMDSVVAAMAVPVPSTGITLSASALTFTEAGTQTLTAAVTPDGCTDAVTWESDNNSIVTVKDGIVTAIANGSAVITVTCGDYRASCAVTVSGMDEAVPCTGITLDKTELTFTEAGSQMLTAAAEPGDTTDKVEWSSDNETVATVDNGVVTALKNGSAVITAKCGNYSAACTVSVSGILPYVSSFEESTWTNGYINDSGVYVEKDMALGDMNMSEYILIQPTTDVYTVSTATATVPYLRISYYDSGLNWIKNQYRPSAGSLCVQPAPENAVAYVVSCKSNGNKAAVTVTRMTYEYPDENIMEGVTWTPGTVIISDGGPANDSGVVLSSGFDITGYAGADVWLTADVSEADALRIAFWDADGAYISGLYGDDQVHGIIPANAVTAKVAKPESAACQILLGATVIGEASAT